MLYVAERDKTSTLQAERDSSALVSQALAAPDAQVVPLSGPGGQGGGALVLASDRKPLVVSDLLPAPPGKVWEVWTIPADGVPVSAGLMQGGSDNVLAAAGSGRQGHDGRHHRRARRRHAARRPDGLDRPLGRRQLAATWHDPAGEQ